MKGCMKRKIYAFVIFSAVSNINTMLGIDDATCFSLIVFSFEIIQKEWII
jgi:hypothetical protein